MNDAMTGNGRQLHLDGLRGLAIGLVLVHHFVVPLLSDIPGSPGAYLAAALTLSYSGVDLFFVLSGYLIGGILMDQRDSPRFFQAFYARRAARILPPAIACILIVLAARGAGLYGGNLAPSPWPVYAYLLFATNLFMAAGSTWGYLPLACLWSLGIEEQFYLVAPWIIRWTRPAKMLVPLLAFILLGPLARIILLGFNSSSITASMLPLTRTDCLGAGMLVSWIMRNANCRAWCAVNRTRLYVLFALTIGAMTFLTKIRADNGGNAMARGGYSAVAAFYGLSVLIVVSHRESRINRILSSAPLVKLGRYSYFIYLFQGTIVGFAVSAVFHHRLAVVSPTSWMELAVGLASLLAASLLSWRFFESPFIALGHRIRY